MSERFRWNTFAFGAALMYNTQRCSQDPRKHLRWRVLQQQLTANQSVITSSKLTIETLEQGVKYVQS